ncbi:MAG: hypothetical protein AAGE43_20825, partial [Pseudomonadota bacterium]
AAPLSRLLPAGTVVVDSAATTAKTVAAALEDLGQGRRVQATEAAHSAEADNDETAGTDKPAPVPDRLTLLATDGEDRFRRVGGYFLGRAIERVELVDL